MHCDGQDPRQDSMFGTTSNTIKRTGILTYYLGKYITIITKKSTLQWRIVNRNPQRREFELIYHLGRPIIQLSLYYSSLRN